MDYLNSIDSNIKFTFHISFTNVQFLDLIIFKGKNFCVENKLSTCIYLKQTSNLKLIHKRSFHPNHIKNSIIKNELNRYYRNCSFFSDFIFFSRKLRESLRLQDYTRTSIRNHIKDFYENKNHEVCDDYLMKGFFPCGANRKCTLCERFGVRKKFLNLNGRYMAINQNLDCTNPNVIYVIECSLCKLVYIGQTGNTLHKRICNHLSTIRTRKDVPVANHFNSDGHSIQDFRFFALISNNKWTDKERILKESQLISKFNNVENGLNLAEILPKKDFIIFPYRGKDSVPHSIKTLLPQHRNSFKLGRNIKAQLSKTNI